MRVWMIIWSYWPGPQGGAERQCRLICPSLIEKGCNCTVISARLSWKNRRDEKDGTTAVRRLGVLIPVVHFIGKAVRGGLSKLFEYQLVQGLFTKKNINVDALMHKMFFWCGLPWVWLARLLFMIELMFSGWKNQKTIDLIHVHETGWLGGFACFLGSFLNIPVVCKEATYPPFPPIGWDAPFSWLLRKYQKQGNFIVLNPQVEEEIITRGGDRERVTTVPNAVMLPEKIASPENSRTVLYVGNFSQGAYQKAFDVLFKAWQKVSQEMPELKLVLAGGGTCDNWKAMVRNLGCENSVDFRGFVSDPESLYLEAGLLVLPSRVEGMSNALLEALSFGLPVVASDIPANQAVVKNEENGKLVPVGDHHALAEAILELMANPEIRFRFGRSGRQIAEKQFDVDSVSSSFVTLYEKLGKKG